MAAIKAVFFDAAGTLFRTREPVGETYARFARGFGVNTNAAGVDAAFRRTFKDASPLAFGPGRAPEELRELERDWWRDLVAKIFAGLGRFTDFDAYFNALFEFFADPAQWIADPQALPVLWNLRARGFTLGVISNFDYRLYRILDGLALSPSLESITISSEAGYAKPAVELFEVALERHRLQPAEAVHLGDSEHLDLAGASAAGIGAVLINPEMTEPISITGRTARIPRLSGILEVVQIWG